MAKWGEGDSRWRVEDLGEQGRNVNSWHWEESNVLPWGQNRVKELFAQGTTLVDTEDVVVVTQGDAKLTGDAIINRRKGKVIPAYELELRVDWKATKKNGENKGETWTGEVKAPYISEENHDEDPEVTVSVTGSGAESEKIRSLVVRDGRPVMYKLIAQFVEELRKGGRSDQGGNADANGGGDGSAAVQEKVEGDTNGKGVDDVVKESRSKALKSSTSKVEKRSLEIKEQYYASASDIYQCFTDTAKAKAYTGSAAEIDAKEGGRISMFGGSIEGTFRKLEPYSLIEMDWRFSSWPDGAMSRVIITLDEKEKGTVGLTLRQEGIPETDRFGNHDVVNMTQAGWKQQMLLRMKQVFGYGI
jgi:activator of HSP90 ATPase